MPRNFYEMPLDMEYDDGKPYWSTMEASLSDRSDYYFVEVNANSYPSIREDIEPEIVD